MSEKNHPVTLHDVARRYLAAGLCVLPARRDEKRPTISWKPYQRQLPTESEVDAWFTNGPSAVCVLCGEVSGHVEIIDFDYGGELFGPWCDRVRAAVPGLLERLVLARTQSGGRHAAYRCEGSISGSLKLAERRLADGRMVTLIETRGEGGLFLCPPTDGYAFLQGDLCDLPVLSEDERDVLLGCAWELNEYLPQVVDGPHLSADHSDSRPSSAENPHSATCPPEMGERPGDDFNSRGDVRAVLQKHGWALARGGENEHWRRPGKPHGWSATLKGGVFYVFSSNAAPFEPQRAYSPFAVYTLLDSGGDFEQAARALRELGYGSDPTDHGVDISHIVAMSAESDDPPQDSADIPDPGPIPDDLLYVPGFIGEVIDFCMANAPYPSLGMAFCGALAMQGHLCGRKVRDSGDLRTNLYLLALASSSAGKNYPRQINSHLAIAANMAEAVRTRFASGEGVEDRLEAQPCTMFQTDEIDGILQSVSKARDARHESIITTLLTMYSSSNMMYPMRSKAGKQAGIIQQPHLIIFGTATPSHYYEALSERMLTNGFFARMIIVDTGKRAPGQDTAPVDTMPKRLVEAAEWWGAFQPGEHRGNLLGFFPRPVTVPYSDEAKGAADAFRRFADEQYGQAEDRSDEVAMTVWGRANENARKLALLYACSENHTAPEVSRAGVDWATAFIEHQVRRMLFMASEFVARDEFDSLCKRAVRVLRDWHAKEGRDALMPPWMLRRRLSLHPTAFKDTMFELEQRRLAIYDKQPGKTKPKYGFRLVRGAANTVEKAAPQEKNAAGISGP